MTYRNESSALTALGATALVVQGNRYPLPTTFTLKSADATRKIEFSTDGGIEYFTPVYDVNSTTMLVVVSKSGISHVRFTGLATDAWSAS